VRLDLAVRRSRNDIVLRDETTDSRVLLSISKNEA